MSAASLKFYIALRSANIPEEAAEHVTETFESFLQARRVNQPDAESKFEAVMAEMRLLSAGMRAAGLVLPN